MNFEQCRGIPVKEKVTSLTLCGSRRADLEEQILKAQVRDHTELTYWAEWLAQGHSWCKEQHQSRDFSADNNLGGLWAAQKRSIKGHAYTSLDTTWHLRSRLLRGTLGFKASSSSRQAWKVRACHTILVLHSDWIRQRFSKVLWKPFHHE